MPANPQYTGDVISAPAVLTTANLNRDGTTGSVITAYTFRAATSGGKGGRIDAMTLTPSSAAATVAGIVLVFVNGVVVREIATTAITPAATVKGYQIPTTEGADANGVLQLGKICQPGDIIKVVTTVTQALTARFEGGEF